MPIKPKTIKPSSLALPRSLALATFGQLVMLLSTKENLQHLLHLMNLRYCFLLIKQNYLLKTFPRTQNLDDSGITFPAFPSRTNLKLHNIHLTPDLVKKVITTLDLPNLSVPDEMWAWTFIRSCSKKNDGMNFSKKSIFLKNVSRFKTR